MTRCSSPTCWCRDERWPPVRLVLSTGQTYTVEELPAECGVRVFRYSYLEAS